MYLIYAYCSFSFSQYNNSYAGYSEEIIKLNTPLILWTNLSLFSPIIHENNRDDNLFDVKIYATIEKRGEQKTYFGQENVVENKGYRKYNNIVDTKSTTNKEIHRVARD